MSELSVRQYLHNDGSGLTLGYDKSEADKVIAEKDAEIADLIEKNKRLANKDIIMARETIKDVFNELNQQKFKRCLDKAKWCFTKSNYHFVLARHGENGKENNRRSILYAKWHKRWRKLAEKFKPNSTAQ